MQIPFVFCSIHLQAHIHPTKEIRVCMQVVFSNSTVPSRVCILFFSGIMYSWYEGEFSSSWVQIGLDRGQSILRRRDHWWVRSFVPVVESVSFIFLYILDESQAQERRTRLGMRSVGVTKNIHTLKYSFVASSHSLFMVDGVPFANDLMVRKRARETPTPPIVYPKTFHPSPGGVWARGPWAPKAM